MRTRAKLTGPLLGAAVAALAVASAGGASHGAGVDPAALHIGQTSTTLSSTTLNCSSTVSCVRLDNSSPTDGARGFRGVHSAPSGAAPGIEGITNSTSSGALGILGRVLLAPGAHAIDSAGVKGTNSGTMGGVGVWGEHAGDGTGVGGRTVSGLGVEGSVTSATADDIGVRGRIEATSAAGTAGVAGFNLGSNADGYGVLGQHSTSGIGTAGRSVTGVGVLGEHSGPGAQPGVRGNTSSAADFAAGVRGDAPSGSLTAGVFGTSSAFGVLGIGGTAGVLGYNPSGVAGYFVGDLTVTGTLTKGAGAFRIDHPLEPETKYLQHSFVESPDMKNVYDGVVRTDRRGFATVRLPRYFQALNRDFRYQLTLVGSAAWGAQAIVWEKIRGNRFVIRSKPRVEVSWQVTGIRKDRFANANRIAVEVTKTSAERRVTALARRAREAVK